MRIDFSASQKTSRLMLNTQNAISNSLQRLSSGKQINSAKDGASDLAKINSLDAKMRGYNQAVLNLNQNAGAIDTASSAISSQLDIVQRMREIAVQASNGTLASSDRASLNSEIQQLFTEYKRISSDTEFNGNKLLDGSFGTQTVIAGDKANNSFQYSTGNTSSAATVQRTIGSGRFQTAATYGSGTALKDARIADFNNDGKADVASLDSTGFNIQVGDGAGHFTTKQVTDFGSTVNGIAVADYNKDGIADLAVTGNNSVGIYLGTGDGTFKFSNTFAANSAMSVSAADFNSDGVMDLAYVDTGTNSVAVVFGNGDGRFQSATTYAAPATGSMRTLGDLNGDGKVDIVVASGSTNSVTVLLNNGNGTFGAANSVGGTFTGMGEPDLGDVNGDGYLDILSFCGGVSVANVFLNNGNGTFAAPLVTPTSGYNRFADVNNDGILDLVGISGSSASVAFHLGNGNGTFKAAVTSSSTPASSRFFDVGDVNGDGVVDLVGGGLSTSLSVSLSSTLTREAGSDVSVATQTKAQTLIGILDSTLNNLKTQQSALGISSSRVQSAANFGSDLSGYYEQAKSVLQDVDVANETAELTKNQIMQQAQVAVLTQANVGVQQIIQLFRSNNLL